MIATLQKCIAVLIIVVSITSLGNGALQTIKFEVQGNSYWPEWTEKSFRCLKTNLVRIEGESSINLEVVDVLLFQRLVELGYPKITFMQTKSTYLVTDDPLKLQKINARWKCGNWVIYDGTR
jgi:hypothetical protein